MIKANIQFIHHGRLWMVGLTVDDWDEIWSEISSIEGELYRVEAVDVGDEKQEFEFSKVCDPKDWSI